MKQERFDHIHSLQTRTGTRYFTESIYPFKGFDEVVIKQDGKKYREVDPERSKLFAGIAKGVSQIGMRDGSSVLYLGASHGYTPSYVSDIIGKNGWMICIDIAPRVVRDLVFVCERRENMAPLLADCRQPQTYKDFVPAVDVIFQDISQRDQVDIFVKNVVLFLKPKGFGLLALKARSVDVSKKPQEIFKEAFTQLEKTPGISVVDKRDLSPLEKDHMLFVVKKQ